MSEDNWDPREHWDERYRDTDLRQDPARVLTENLHLLPAEGKALDLACGLGANAVLLAERGLKTWAWDISPVAIRRLEDQSWEANLDLEAVVRDVTVAPPEADSFDVIVVSRFLDRALAPKLVEALRPGGLLFYQTFTREKIDEGGPGNPDFLLEDGELLKLFAALQPRVYREEGLLGDTSQGFRNEALLVAQKKT